MAEKKTSERKLILFTVGLLIVAGLVRLVNYKVGVVFFYLAFIPFIYHRVKFYYKNRVNLSNVDKYRKITLILILVTIALNFIGWQDIEFFLLFILAVDYLIIVNSRKTPIVNEK